LAARSVDRDALSPERLKQAATAGRRSSLYRWMLDHFDEFRTTLAKAGRPNWDELAKAFGEGGLTDRVGRSPNGEGARQTWWLVRRAVAKQPALIAKPKPAATAPLGFAPAILLQPVMPTAPTSETDGAEFEFRTLPKQISRKE